MFLASAFLFVALPWLNPFSPGPTPNTLPWLFSVACTAALIGGYNWMPSQMRREILTNTFAPAWLAASLASSVMGLLQYFGVTSVLEGLVSSATLGQAYANLRQRNQFATLTNIGLVSLLWWSAAATKTARLSVDLRRCSPLQNLLKSWPVVVAVLLAVGNAASSSRTGLVQLVMLSATGWFWTSQGPDNLKMGVRRVLVVAGLTYIISALSLPGLVGLHTDATGILARLNDSGPSCSSRLTLWSNVLQLVAQKPWSGWGWGELGYAHFITLYPGTRFCDILDNAHNLPLHLAVELGIPAAVLACGGSLWLVWRAKPWCEAEPTRQMAWMVLALILLHSMLEYPLWYGPFQMTVGLSIWILIRPPVRMHGNHKPCRPLEPYLYAQAAAILIAFCCYAAWDYWRISQIYLSPASRASAYQENTLEKIQGSWLFQNQVRFAELTTMPATANNAAHVNAVAKALLHFSPEARVVEKLIESAVLLGKDDEAVFYLARYQAAYPDSHIRWTKLPNRAPSSQ